MSNSNWPLAAKAMMNPGLKIRCEEWDEGEFVFYKNGIWFDEHDSPEDQSFRTGSWQEYKEPKPELKFRVEKMYHPVFKGGTSGATFSTIEEALKYDVSIIGYVEIDVHVLEGGDNGEG